MAEGGPVERGKHKKSTSGLFLSLRLTKTCSGNWSTMVPPGYPGQSLAIPGRLASHNVGIALRHLATHLYDTYSQCQNHFPPKLHTLVNLVRLLVCNFKLFNFYPVSQLVGLAEYRTREASSYRKPNLLADQIITNFIFQQMGRPVYICSQQRRPSRWYLGKFCDALKIFDILFLLLLLLA